MMFIFKRKNYKKNCDLFLSFNPLLQSLRGPLSPPPPGPPNELISIAKKVKKKTDLLVSSKTVRIGGPILIQV
jgi:hypothetical protein